jgi:hypothetical protein
VGRGLAQGDFDNDGRIDLLLVAQNAPVAYFHNQTKDPKHFLTLRLEGHGLNRDATGARVAVKVGGRTRTAWRFGGGSYASASDARLHFGLGASGVVEEVEVRWPSGRVSRWSAVAADWGYLVREDDGSMRPLAGFSVGLDRER